VENFTECEQPDLPDILSINQGVHTADKHLTGTGRSLPFEQGFRLHPKQEGPFYLI
jgi:hypothetical protein